MNLTPEQKQMRKSFRLYLTNVAGVDGSFRKSLINAAEIDLPALINQYICNNFGCIYDHRNLQELVDAKYQLKLYDEENALSKAYISCVALDHYIHFYAKEHNLEIPSVSKDESDHNTYIEGRITEAAYFRRSRNRKVKEECLKKSNYTCYACGFNFEKFYGEIGKNFLEVHHLKPMSAYDDEHEIPQSELCALCSNCHSMVHRKKDVMDVNELKRQIELAKKLNGK